MPEPVIEPYLDPEDRVQGDEEVIFDEEDDQIFVVDEPVNEE